jgi:hypothetical protein
VLVFAGTLLLSWGVTGGAGRFAPLARQFLNAASNAGWRSASSRKMRPSG